MGHGGVWVVGVTLSNLSLLLLLSSSLDEGVAIVLRLGLLHHGVGLSEHHLILLGRLEVLGLGLALSEHLCHAKWLGLGLSGILRSLCGLSLDLTELLLLVLHLLGDSQDLRKSSLDLLGLFNSSCVCLGLSSGGGWTGSDSFESWECLLDFTDGLGVLLLLHLVVCLVGDGLVDSVLVLGVPDVVNELNPVLNSFSIGLLLQHGDNFGLFLLFFGFI